MKTYNPLKLTLSVAAALLVTVLAFALTTETASAHCTLYHPHHCAEELIEDPADALIRDLPPESSSCLAVMSYDDYDFRINNQTPNTVYYSINGTEYYLWADHHRDHTFPKTRGSNSCNAVSYPRPQIEFDFSYSSGYQELSYNIGDYDVYNFQQSSNGLDLHHVAASAASSGNGSGSATVYTGSNHIAYGDVRYDQVTSSSGDAWTFQGSAGEWVEIGMYSNDVDTYLELRTPSGYLLAEDDDSGGDYNSFIRIDSLPSTGTYTIIARSYSGDTGSYQLTLD